MAMSSLSQDQPDGGAEDDLSAVVQPELEVVLNRWSIGQIDWPDVLVALGVLAVAALIAAGIRRAIRRSSRKLDSTSATALNLIGQLVSIGILAFAFALALDVLGFTLGPVLILALLLFVLWLVFRPLIVNVSSGLFLQLRGYCRPGDLVAIDDEIGVVDEINARSVVLETVDGRTVILPNDKVMADKIVNYSRVGRRRSELTLRLPADADLSLVTDQVSAALEELPSVLQHPEPRVVVTGFDGPQIWVEVHYWSAPGLDEEIDARDAVGRALRTHADVTLSDASSVVHLRP